MKSDRSATDDDARDLVKGTLDMLILKALEISPTHGWGVADRIETLSRGVFRLLSVEIPVTKDGANG